MEVENAEEETNPACSLNKFNNNTFTVNRFAINQKHGLESSNKHFYSRFRNPNPSKIQNFKGVDLEIEERYTITKIQDYCVYKVTDTLASQEKDKIISIKKIENALDHEYSMKKNLRELKILRTLNHENVIDIKRLLLPTSREKFKNLYICSTFMEADLAAIIRSQQPLSNEHYQYFVYQILRGLKYIHSAGVIHFGLKPRNILINSNCDIKISNFYLAKFSHIKDKLFEGFSDGFEDPKWYMPPEILLGKPNFDPAVDVWSTGCILAELINRRAFLNGTGLIDQLNCIFDVFGTPTEEYVASLKQERFGKYLISLKAKQPKDLESLFPKDTDPLAIDLIRKMLILEWRERITVEEALQHPYLKDLHEPHDEPIRSLLPAVEFDYENYELSLKQWGDILYEEVLLYHFEDFREEHDKKVKEGVSPSERVRGNAVKKNKKIDND